MIDGLPDDAAIWRQDKPAWSNQDEWAAEVLEAIGWLRFEMGSLLLWLGGAKPNLPEPRRIEHPDRPGPTEAAVAAKQITSDPDEIASFFGLTRKGVRATP